MKWLVAVACLFVILLVLDIRYGEVRNADAVVVDRSYAPAHTDVGTGVDGNGRAVTTVTPVSEKWVVVVRSGGRVYGVEVSAGQWAVLERGQGVVMWSRVSRLGFVYTRGIYQ